MELYEAIKTRKTIRDFEQVDGAPRPLDAALINRIIDAGFAAPTNDHMRKWHFVLLNDPDRRKEIVTQVIHPLTRARSKAIIDRWGLTDPDQRETYLDAIPKQFSMLMQCGCLILPFYHQSTPLLKPKTLSHLNSFASIWLCVENMLLAAASEGVFGVMRIPAEEERKAVKTFLNVPEGYEFPCWLALGYPAANAERKKQIIIYTNERIHYDLW